VPGLIGEAFSVWEDGDRQTIQFFATQDAPVTVGLLIDSSGSMLAVRNRVIAAAGTFAETSNPDDEIFALVFSDDVRAALPPEAPFTSDSSTLRSALGNAISSRGRTALYDAILAGLEYLDKGRHQRKVLVVLSDGGDNASKGTLEEVLRQTQTSNTVVYTIGLIDPVDREASPRRLKQLSDASGGETFQPENFSQISDVMQRVARDIRNSYTLGYAPKEGDRGGRFRRIRVAVNAPELPGLSVRTRQGYVMGDK
jgi:VWFA-related protein